MGQLIKQFGKIKVTTPIPHLLTLQLDSYSKFLQEGVPADKRREDVGLEGVFRTVFPIEDFNKTASLEFESYEIQEPKYDQAECISKGLTYEAPVRIKVRLAVYDVDDATGERNIRDIKEQDIYFGTLPLMTEKGTFIVNGTERVIVNQLQRSPGIIFEHDGGKTHASHKVLYSCRVIPMRGSWLDFDFDHKDILYVRIDRRRKMPVTILFKAMGMSKTDILDYFYPKELRETYYLDVPEGMQADVTLRDEKPVFWKVNKDLYRKEPAYTDIADQNGKVIAHAGKLITKRQWRLICESGMNAIQVRPDTLEGMFLSEDIIDPQAEDKTAPEAVLAQAADELTPELIQTLRDKGIKEITVLHTKGPDVSSSIRDTLVSDKTPDQEKAQEEIYRRLRPSSPPTPEIAKSFFDNIFRNVEYYDLSPVGRYKLNQRLHFPQDYGMVDDGNGNSVPCRTLTDNDILTAIKTLCTMKDTHAAPDDIDHLGNRRVRLVGELVENQYRIGLVRMERAIKERMSLQEISTLMPHDLINPKPVAAVLKEFFGTSQLSQFMDQTNALSEVTHKRRLSALGPGGLTRDRAGFEVRDVHTSHYGRICPIETPEGPNIGLIVSLSTYARVNDFGFIETPYRVIRDCQKTDEVVSLEATREADNQVIAQANARFDENGRLADDNITVRVKGEVEMRPKEEVTLMDVAPGQMVSISAALIPFLEHDDANRALMGSNMQRQAVPLLKPQSPIIGTGMEYKAAKDSGVVVLSKQDGVVEKVSADEIVIKDEVGERHKYHLLKFLRSNQGTCINQRPIVETGEQVTKGMIIADGPATDNGEIALGRNVLVGFMTWEGYNYEDAVLLNEKLVRDDIFTSVHIEEYESESRDTKLGPEEITREIPNVGDDALKNLDDRGIIRVGAEVHSGDILVGKVTPKGETELTPEERLLRAIFGEKAREVRDTSLRVPHGEAGIIVDVKVFTRENNDELPPGVNEIVRCYIAQKRKISVGDKMAGRHGNKGVVSRILPSEDMPFLPDGTPLDIVLNPLGVPSRMNIGQVLEVHLGMAASRLGFKVATPVFDGANEKDIMNLLEEAGLRRDGKTVLYDGRTGQPFDNPVTVGYMYYLKLHHLVDDKIHARSTGPYSLVTQQPLGGKAQFGGQRFGEMEVWALEAYGAAYLLQEILTVKSDDVVGRVKTYEAIVKGENVPAPGIPESFKVLIKELQSLALDVNVLDANNEVIDLRSVDEDDEPNMDEYKDELLTTVNDGIGSGYSEVDPENEIYDIVEGRGIAASDDEDDDDDDILLDDYDDIADDKDDDDFEPDDEELEAIEAENSDDIIE